MKRIRLNNGVLPSPPAAFARTPSTLAFPRPAAAFALREIINYYKTEYFWERLLEDWGSHLEPPAPPRLYPLPFPAQGGPLGEHLLRCFVKQFVKLHARYFARHLARSSTLQPSRQQMFSCTSSHTATAPILLRLRIIRYILSYLAKFTCSLLLCLSLLRASTRASLPPPRLDRPPPVDRFDLGSSVQVVGSPIFNLLILQLQQKRIVSSRILMASGHRNT